MAEKLCLKWNDFQENISNAFRSFGDSLDFADVTLACEDGEQFEAHKIILATSSPIFQNLLNRNKNTNPIIYMRGVKSADLRAIVDFLYQGEANVFQDDLDSFLAIAERGQSWALVLKPRTLHALCTPRPRWRNGGPAKRAHVAPPSSWPP